jgi:hypothetical protein
MCRYAAHDGIPLPVHQQQQQQQQQQQESLLV